MQFIYLCLFVGVFCVVPLFVIAGRINKPYPFKRARAAGRATLLLTS
jgi:hypothetical protein